MPYLVDGHNLIPKAGLSLRSIEDEQELIERLQAFCRHKRTRVEVYFDKAPPGQAKTKRYGAVTAHFVREGQSADEAIIYHLHRLGGEAKNWVVVSSDHLVQEAARRLHARIATSEDFARQLNAATTSSAETSEKPEAPADIETWLRLFSDKSTE